MRTITIVTPANIEVEYRLAGAGSRTAAVLIDLFIQILSILLVFFLIWAFDRQFFDQDASADGVVMAILTVIIFIINVGYFILCEMLMNGQTIGKRIFGLRTIRENGQPISFTQSLIRGLFRSSLDMLYVGLISIFIHRHHKRLGDMAAGTIVVGEHKHGKNEWELTIHKPDFPNFLPDKFEMTADERLIVEDWLSRREGMTDYGEAIGRQLDAHFRKKAADAEALRLKAQEEASARMADEAAQLAEMASETHLHASESYVSENQIQTSETQMQQSEIPIQQPEPNAQPPESNTLSSESNVQPPESNTQMNTIAQDQI